MIWSCVPAPPKQLLIETFVCNGNECAELVQLTLTSRDGLCFIDKLFLEAL